MQAYKKAKAVKKMMADLAATHKPSKMKVEKRPKLGTGARFMTLETKLSKKGVKNPAGLAAYIGRKKFGAKKMAKLSANGKK